MGLEDLGGALRPQTGPMLHFKGVAVATVSAARSLTYSSSQIQKLTVSGGNQDVNLPAASAAQEGAYFLIYNAGASNSALVKTSVPTTLATLAPGDVGWFEVSGGQFVAAALWQGGTSITTGALTATSAVITGTLAAVGVTFVGPVALKDPNAPTKIATISMAAITAGQTRALSMADFDVNLNTGPFTENTDGVIPISHVSYTAVSGVWTRSRSAAANYKIARTAAATVEALAIEVPTIALRSTASKGRKITGLNVKYSIATAAANDVTVSIGYTVLPANGSAVAAASTLGSISYDANHDTSAKRKTVAEHTMQVTFGSPVYLADCIGFEVLVTVDAALTTAFSVSQVELLTAETLVDAT